MEQKRIKVRLTKNSPYSDYGYYEKGDIGYIDGYVNDNAVIILENGKFAKADLRWIEVVNEEDKNVNTELKESEDERISKHLLYHFQNKTKEEWNGMPVKDILAWIEEQEQHKKFRDSIQVGDKVTKNEDGVLVNLSQLKRVAKKDEKQGEQKPNPCENCSIATNNCQNFPCAIRNGEQKPADKVEPKFKVGDWVAYDGWHCQITEVREDGYCNSMNGFIPKEREDSMHLIITEPAWSEEDNIILSRIIADYERSNEEWFNAQKSLPHGRKITWLKSLKDRVLPQPKQEWSEEDERLFQIIIDILDKEEHKGHLSHTDLIACVKKLKSLRPQNRWKPSGFHLECISDAIIMYEGRGINATGLKEILEELKKLREK